ncbi:RPN2B [Symbiodinium sp. CCMP2456]|nr:RPN2B [Symbiodinium sp. CCMP2456]
MWEFRNWGLRAYAHDTQHEKIIRACALALAMMMFRKEEEAEPLIQEMLLDKDAILRYGGCFAIALAYVGTSQNAAIRKLLHISVSDVSDDVRRAAVMALGFVMCNVPEQLPGVVKLLAESKRPSSPLPA